MKDTPHRFFQFAVPTHAPHFDDPARRWTTFVGEFLAPIVRDRAVEGFMFLNHQPADYELRLAARDYGPLEVQLRRRAQAMGIQITASPTDGQTIGSDTYGESRFIAQNRMGDAEARARRTTLVFQAVHAACELYLDNLVPDGATYWQREANGHQQHNPRGNMFESIIHLNANLSGADFDVFVVPPPVVGTLVFTRGTVPASAVVPVHFQQPPAAAPAHNDGVMAICRL